MVSPGDTGVSCGDVQALFPFGALVNHSCRPNSCFHSVAESSPRGPEIELVLRTTFGLRAGDELCVAYFPDYVETPVAVSVWDLTNRGKRLCVRCIRLIRSDRCRCTISCVNTTRRPASCFMGHVVKSVRNTCVQHCMNL